MFMEHLQYAKHCARHMENTERARPYPEGAHSFLWKRYYSLEVEEHSVAIGQGNWVEISLYNWAAGDPRKITQLYQAPVSSCKTQ